MNFIHYLGLRKGISFFMSYFPRVFWVDVRSETAKSGAVVLSEGSCSVLQDLPCHQE